MTGMPKLIQYFIMQNNVNELDNNNNTALIYAVTADKETVDSKALLKTVSTLVKNGANVNLRNGEQKTALAIAEERQMVEITGILKPAVEMQTQRNIRIIKKH
jgi:ankyrin repeat protein